MMEQSAAGYCCLCRSSLESAKGKGKQKKYMGQSCTRQREILEKFVETFNLSQALLPTGGTLCYCCLIKLNKWDKMTTEITVIQEELKTYLKESLRRHKRTLSEAEREGSSAPPEAENRTDVSNKSLDMSVRVQFVCTHF